MLFPAQVRVASSTTRANHSKTCIVLQPSHFISINNPSPSSINSFNSHVAAILVLIPISSTSNSINIPHAAVLPASKSTSQEPKSITQEPHSDPQEPDFVLALP